ncbi:DUF6292 family protein [Amycolatopsis sp., V23-08]|uniref:DUF6292 family protein n=1 Tax=Amycolatopsis heterodermiae TaxID=3110235 RepID=A0ABU5RB90_9PSEU|nr:DUF6292 family protein [Amycolatopsis sp., V23-08]MEA5363522.1 DUF6292 family protein [Amycolatopsis sp., V23-08]
MTTEPSDENALIPYLRAVAAELGLLAEDAAVEPADPLYGQIRFAGRPADGPAKHLLLTWDRRDGWQLNAAGGRSGSLHVVATLPGEIRPAPRAVADFTLEALADRGERLIRRQYDGDRLSILLDRYAEPAKRRPRRTAAAPMRYSRPPNTAWSRP